MTSYITNFYVTSYITNVLTTCVVVRSISIPSHQIRVCKIRFVSARKNRGKPCLVCKKKNFFHGCEMHTEKSVPLHHSLASLGKPYNAEQ